MRKKQSRIKHTVVSKPNAAIKVERIDLPDDIKQKLCVGKNKIPDKKTLIICIGSMGSGKTYFIKEFMKDDGFTRVSQDEQGKSGHLRLFKSSIFENRSIVIDRMNFDVKQRARYTGLAKENGYQIIYLWFPTPPEICRTRMCIREDHPTIGQNDDHDKLLEWYDSVFVKPSPDEYDLFFNMLYQPHVLELFSMLDSK